MCGSDYDSYERKPYSSGGWKSSSGFGESRESVEKLSVTRSLHPDMDPTDKILKSNAKYPIIFVLDVTGSNKNFANLVYDKFPMMYGQIKGKYLNDFEVCVCAVGDETDGDRAALQIGDFTSDGLEFDKSLEKIYREGGGGEFGKESYELAAYYLLKNTEFAPESKPMVFFIGDEIPYPEVKQSQISKYKIGERTADPLESFAEADGKDADAVKKKRKESLKTTNVFNELNKKFKNNVFMYLNKACGDYFIDSITEKWNDLTKQGHTIMIPEEKAIADLTLGTIALVTRKRDIEAYKIDMKERDQDAHRIAEVAESLKPLEKTLLPAIRTDGLVTKTDAKKSDGRSIRL